MIERVFRKLFNQAVTRTAIKAGMRVGEGVRFIGAHNFGSEPYLIEIGDNVTISSEVSFINHDGGTVVIKRLDPSKYANVLKFGRIIIEDTLRYNTTRTYNCIFSDRHPGHNYTAVSYEAIILNNNSPKL